LDDAACSGATPVCDPAANACVACLADADCPSLAAPQCDTASNTCVACTASTACAGRSGTEVCNTTSGACVACTAADRAACDANVCDGATNTCTTFAAGSAGLCQPCVADAQCAAGQLCVPTTFGSTAAPAGKFCLWRLDAMGTGAPGGACSRVPPYVRVQDTTSVDGVATMACGLRATTCPALNAYSSTNCMTLDAAGDARCGVEVLDDGLCRALDSATNLCTVPCASDIDCPGTTCNTGVTPRVCAL
jgi:Cys-rich repeat protein